MNTRADKSANWQRWLFAGLIVAFLWVIATRFAEIQRLAGTLSAGNWFWMAAAIALELAYHVGFAALFKRAFDVTDVDSSLHGLIPIAFAFLFVNTTTASGGTAGLALFVDDVRRRGGSAARATAGTLLAHAANYGMFAAILSLSLFFLYQQHDLTGLELASALILFALVAVLAGTLLLGWRWPAALRRLLHAVQRGVNRLGGWVKRPSLLPNTWAETNAADFIEAAAAIARHPRRLGHVLLGALLVHLLHVGVLLCIFLAFDQPVTPGILLAGYTISILFMIVSPTPNGIGVVETVVPLMYSSLGVTADKGFVITFAFRGITFWIPMLIGFVLLRQLRMFRGPGRTLADSGQVRLLAVLTALMGAVNLLTAVQPTLLAPIAGLTRLSPVAVREGSRITAVLTGFILLILARGLWRHKRAAWWLTLIVLLVAVASHLLQPDPAAALLGSLLAAYLIAQRNHFHALSDAPSLWQGIQVLAAALAFTLVYGLVGFYVLSLASGEPFSLLDAWWRSLLLFATLREPTFSLQPADYFGVSIYIVGAATLGYALIMLLRPVLVTRAASSSERRRARAIVAAHGRSPLAPQTLTPDKTYFFSPGGSVIAYARRRGTVVVLGEPIGPPEDHAAAVADFGAFCRRHDWQPAFYRISADARPLYQAAGFNLLRVGQAARIDLAGSTAVPPEPPPHTHVVHPPLNQNLVEQLRLVSDDWLQLVGHEEQPFAGGWFGRAYLNRGPVALLTNAEGAILAFAALAPIPAAQTLAVGLLRYRPQVQADQLRSLLLAAAGWARQQGYAQLDLGLLQDVQDPAAGQRPFLARQLRRLRLRFSPWLNQAALQAAQTAVATAWQPQYLAYPGPASLPAVWAALSQRVGDVPLS